MAELNAQDLAAHRENLEAQLQQNLAEGYAIKGALQLIEQQQAMLAEREKQDAERAGDIPSASARPAPRAPKAKKET